MNNNDKEAFDNWFKDAWDIDFDAYDFRHTIQLKAWQAAVDYKQKEIEEDEDRLRNHMNSIGYGKLKKLKAENAFLKENINGTKMKQMNDRIEQLKAKNEKLCDVLGKIANEEFESFGEMYEFIARCTLKEVGE
jgi:hypothetical protein